MALPDSSFLKRSTAVSSPSLPSLVHQASYFATGTLAGAASLPAELAWLTFGQKPPISTVNFPRASGPSIVFRGGVRFWTFDLVRCQLNQTSDLPIWIKSGLGGAAGGFNEVLLHSFLSTRRLPSWKAAGSQTLKLFFCFGTYHYLSTTLSPEQLPPKPFPWCWAMGMIAGAVGSGVVGALEGLRGPSMWMGAVPRGSLAIGTTIAVQVTSCDALLKAIECKR